MRIPRLYLTKPLACDMEVELDKRTANHVTRVLRLNQGAQLILFNGNGGEYKAIITIITPTIVKVKIGHFISRESESSLNITLLQGISRGERMDYTLQKSVELGVNKIVPLFTERCEVKLKGERLEKRLQHWQAIIAGACEQSGRNRLPEIQPAVKIEDWQADDKTNELRIVLDHTSRQSLASITAPTDAISILVGPEGGLSNDEINLAVRLGFTRIRLGPRILRTETASIAVLAALQTLWGDFTD